MTVLKPAAESRFSDSRALRASAVKPMTEVSFVDDGRYCNLSRVV